MAEGNGASAMASQEAFQKTLIAKVTALDEKLAEGRQLLRYRFKKSQVDAAKRREKEVRATLANWTKVEEKLIAIKDEHVKKLDELYKEQRAFIQTHFEQQREQLRSLFQSEESNTQEALAKDMKRNDEEFNANLEILLAQESELSLIKTTIAEFFNIPATAFGSTAKYDADIPIPDEEPADVEPYDNMELDSKPRPIVNVLVTPRSTPSQPKSGFGGQSEEDEDSYRSTRASSKEGSGQKTRSVQSGSIPHLAPGETWKCDLCDFSTATYGWMIRHKKQHEREKASKNKSKDFGSSSPPAQRADVSSDSRPSTSQAHRTAEADAYAGDSSDGDHMEVDEGIDDEVVLNEDSDDRDEPYPSKPTYGSGTAPDTLPTPWKCDKCNFTTRRGGWIKRHEKSHEADNTKIKEPVPEVNDGYDSVAPAAAAVQPLSASVDSVDPHLFDDGANDQPMDEAEAEQIQGLFDKTKNLYVCNKCSFSTVRKGWISRHMKTHLPAPPEKLYVCQGCGSKYIEKYFLERHLRKLTDPRFFPCMKCHSVFINAEKLEEHFLATGYNKS